MRRSKLEIYLDILDVLSIKGPLKLTHIMYKSNVNCKVLKEQLDFLLRSNLIEERFLPKDRVVYALSQRGLSVLRAFREIKHVLQIEEETHQAPRLF